jgi:hypothetical protein|tara:strand:- start:355 stop:474 length:120 start_codon:yes stop_codon:yes gene_type:complete
LIDARRGQIVFEEVARPNRPTVVERDAVFRHFEFWFEAV